MCVYAAGCLSEPHFSLESHETCENVVRKDKKVLENGTAKSAHQWGSFTHPQNEVAFSVFFWVRSPPGAPVGSEKNRMSGNAVSPGGNGVFPFPGCAPFACFLGVRVSERKREREREKKKKQKRKKKQYKQAEEEDEEEEEETEEETEEQTEEQTEEKTDQKTEEE